MRPHRAPGSHDEDLKRRLSWPPIRRLLGLFAPYRGYLALASFLTIFVSLFQLGLPIFGRIAVDKITQSAKVSDVDFYAAILAGLILGAGLFSYFQFLLAAYAGNSIVKDLRERVFAHLQRLPVAYFDVTRSGDIASHLSNDVSQLQLSLTSDFSTLVGNLVTFSGGLLIAVWLNWRLTLIAFGVLVPIMGFFVTCGRQLRKTNRSALDALADAMGSITEALSNIRLVKAFARESHEDERASGRLQKVFQLSMKSSRLEGLMGAVGFSGGFLMLVGCMWFGIRGVITGQFTAGAVAGFVLGIFIVLPPMAQLAALFTRLQRALGASERLFAILDHPQEAADVPHAAPFPAGQSAVKYDAVEFSYIPETPVLTSLKLEIQAGKLTAVVGPSGAGKSTLASLLYRFYEPQGGSITINGVRVQDIQRSSLRENIGIVPQDPILFNGTIMENIRYGRLNASDAEVLAASRDANVDEFVSGFAKGYETIIGERGVTLSGGQRQRVAIARAILKDPRILILDEATSALDNVSEALVKEALDRLMHGRTTLVIAHRLSTIRKADQIAVVSEGRVVETGTHSQLIDLKGTYAELYELVDA